MKSKPKDTLVQEAITIFRKKFCYGDKWKTYDHNGSPALIEPKKVESFFSKELEAAYRADRKIY